MEPFDFLRDLLIVFAVAAGVVFVFQRIRVPSVVGLLVAGVLIGPYGLSLIHETERVETLAEIGVVVLLFAVGLEFSLPRLVGMGRLMARVGLPQVSLCVAIGAGLTVGYFGDLRPAVFVGLLLAMSSTAVVFKLLSDRGEMASPHGNVAAAVLLFQDLLVVVCMVILPLLAEGGDAEPSLWRALGLGTLVVALLLVVGRYLVPHLLFQVVRTHNRELFLMVLVLLCLGSAALTASMGWSLAVGAFLAGLALSESEYATQTLAEVLPFRDTLSCLFFISVGMLLDVQFLIANLALVLVTVLALVVLKFAAGGLPTLLAGYPLRIAVLTGVTLAQIGEFSFILAHRGLALGLVDHTQHQTFLAAAVLTITLTPLLIALGPRVADAIATLPIPRRWRVGRWAAEMSEQKVTARGHVVIVGYGLNGRNLARVLQAVDIDYVVLELNPETVRQARKRGEPVYYGDCTRPAVLKHVGLNTSRQLVVAISDPASTRRAVEVARRINPSIHIIVRTRYLSEVQELRLLGANVIIPEEFETSVEIFAQVLREYDLPPNLIRDLIERVRREQYEVLRDTKVSPMRVVLPHANILEKLDIKSCWLRQRSPVHDRTLGELNLRTATGATLLAARRGSELFLNPGPDFRLKADDIAILIGERGQVERAIELLDPPAGPATEGAGNAMP
ncbi:MAG: cation:proton antiporter [Gemmataceae bacterium]|nr:cation:proton antiporter [Gemmataceae bacterium]